jgi:hypothetical protein
MLRLAKVGLAILIVISVAGVLITPDSSDDVDGALQRRPLVKTVLVSVAALPAQVSLPVVPPVPPVVLRRQAAPDLLVLVCVRLC